MDYEYICKLLNGKIICHNHKKSFNAIFKIDSRLINEGDCFIAVNSGYKFIGQAIEKGASLIITEVDYYDNSTNIIKVNNVIESLGILAKELRQKYIKKPLIAITGSVGKTTTKELIANILESKYKVLKTSGNNNNEIGVPLTLFKLNNNYDLVVLELGMNHLKEISKLSKMSIPNIAIITNIGTSHIGHLKNKKNILKAKLEILDGMKNGKLFINGDDKYLKRIKYKKTVKVGLNKNNELIANNIITTEENLYFTIKLKNRRYNVKFNIPNKSLVTNILIAIAIGLEYDIPILEIINKIKDYKQLNHRNEIIKFNNTILIDDCYNSSIESFKSGLEMLNNYKQEKVVIIGDILELGRSSKKIHKRIGKLLRKEKAIIMLVGKEVKYAYHKKFIKCKDNEEVKTLLEKIDLSDKIIYLKASRGMKLEEIKNYILQRYK